MSAINLYLEGVLNEGENGILSIDTTDLGHSLTLEVYSTQEDKSVVAQLATITLANSSLNHVAYMLSLMSKMLYHHCGDMDL